MADLLSNSIPKFPLFNPGYTPPKLFHPLSAANWRRRRRKPPQIIFFCKPNSQNFELISTHEHVDGSLIFRFGDPSELPKEDELVEPKLEKVEEFSVVKVLDTDCEGEVVVNTAGRKVRNEGLTDANVKNSSLLEKGTEPDEQLCNNSDDRFASSVHQTGLLDRSEPEVSAKDVVPLKEIIGGKDGGKVSIQSTDNVEGQAERGDRESSENVVALEEILVEEDVSEASITLTDNVELQAEQVDRGSSEKSASKVTIENAVPFEEILIEKEDEKASVPLTDNVEVPAEQVVGESNEKFAPELSTKNVVEEKDNGEALISLTDNGSTSLEVPVEQGNREPSEKSASQFSTTNIVTLEETVIDKDENEASIPLTDSYGASLEVQAAQGDSELSEKLLEDSIAEVHDSSGSEVTKENAILTDGTLLGEHDAEGSVSLIDNSGASAQVQAVESVGESVVQSVSSDSMNVTVNFVDQETSEDDESIKHFTTDTIEQSSLKDSIEDNGENQTINSSTDADNQNSQICITDDSKENEVVELIPMSLSIEAEPVLDEEVSHEMQELYDPDKTQIPMSLNDDSPNFLLEVEQTEDVESREPTEASGHEMVEMESTGVSITNKGIDATELVLCSGAALLPHPSKALTGGEDAYFVTDQNWLGIADGVGQWSLEGIYPGVYSRELMENCEKVILQCGSDSRTDPKVVLKLSMAKVESPGFSTALIAHFDGQAFNVANIGDSGFMIIRNGIIYQKSSPMLHAFNFPIQIESGDDPSQILEGYRIELYEGDTVVTGTDGLFDNLYDQEITLIVMKSLEANKTPKEIAEILATRAQEVGSATSGRTPFSDAAQAAGYAGHAGGKLDDVAVIVSVVQKHTG